tara:strand:- start:3760 stop:4188 length:429 start_codon:yes stop_codon:yes gene_type:complete
MIYLGSDHGGFKLKEKIRIHLTAKGIEWEDLGVHQDKTKSDFPDYAKAVAKKVVKHKTRGILICSNGVGVSIAANRIKGVRAAMIYDKNTAVGSVADDNANIACLRGLNTSHKKQIQLLDLWLKAKFKALPRYIRRIRKLDK